MVEHYATGLNNLLRSFAKTWNRVSLLAVKASVVYRLLARHGWRKVAPDTRHPKSSPAAQQEWKKTPRGTGGPAETR